MQKKTVLLIYKVYKNEFEKQIQNKSIFLENL